MNLRTCQREAELLRAVREARWPLAAEPELRAHVSGCRRCSGLAIVMTAFQQARAEEGRLPRVAPGTLWWRAHLLRRRRALETAMRPIFIAEVAALVAVLAVFTFSVWRWVATSTASERMINLQTGSLSPAAFVRVIADAPPAMFALGAVTMMVLIGVLALYVKAARES